MEPLKTISKSNNHNIATLNRRISIPPVYKEGWTDYDSKNNNQDNRKASLNVPENSFGKVWIIPHLKFLNN